MHRRTAEQQVEERHDDKGEYACNLTGNKEIPGACVGPWARRKRHPDGRDASAQLLDADSRDDRRAESCHRRRRQRLPQPPPPNGGGRGLRRPRATMRNLPDDPAQSRGSHSSASTTNPLLLLLASLLLLLGIPHHSHYVIIHAQLHNRNTTNYRCSNTALFNRCGARQIYV